MLFFKFIFATITRTGMISEEFAIFIEGEFVMD